MREILFKAKQKDWRDLPKESWWIEGYYAMMGKGNLIRHYIVQNCALTGLFEDPEENMYFNDIEVNPETLCQYTGLKDKNGNRIWENDIVRTSKFGKDDGNGHNYAGFDVFVVKWDDGGFALFNKWRRFNLRTDEKSYEILGKVFDNPELLKGE